MPPAQRRATDDVDIGELVRNLAALTSSVDRINDKLDNLSMQFTPREVHELAVGGMKIDLRRIDEERVTSVRELRRTTDALDSRLDEQEREVARRFRNSVLVTITSLLAPLTVALVVFVLTRLAGTA